MKTTRRFGKLFVAGTLCAAMAFGAVGLTTPAAEARGPILLCGPSLLWVCSGFGPDILFGGTRCDVIIFMQQTGLKCVPYTW